MCTHGRCNLISDISPPCPQSALPLGLGNKPLPQPRGSCYCPACFLLEPGACKVRVESTVASCSFLACKVSAFLSPVLGRTKIVNEEVCMHMLPALLGPHVSSPLERPFCKFAHPLERQVALAGMVAGVTYPKSRKPPGSLSLYPVLGPWHRTPSCEMAPSVDAFTPSQGPSADASPGGQAFPSPRHCFGLTI